MPEIGHNAKASDAVTAFHLSGLMKAAEDKASQDGKYSSYLSKLQRKGIDTDAAKEALKIHKAGNATDKVAYLQKLASYLRILGTPLESDQADLFAKPSGSQTPEDKAKEQGFGAGILGLPMTDNPHGVESEIGQAWLNAWHDGQKERTKVSEQERAEEEQEAQETEAPQSDDGQSDIEDAA